jgi:YD repeat-containing protein
MSLHGVVTSSSKSIYGGEPDGRSASSFPPVPPSLMRPSHAPDVSDMHGDFTWGAPEELDVDPFTGACTYRLPLRIPRGRDNFTPDLSLTYNSARRNSPFGWGWQLRVPSISRSVWPDMPKYADETDVFALSEDELVPALRVSGGWIDDRFTVGEYVVQRFRRRYEGPHDRIERWTHQPSSQTHWRVIDANNVTSQFGTNDESRVADPGDPTRVLQWLLTEQFDDRGNIIRYTYKRETVERVDGSPNATRYLKKIQYANAQPHDRAAWHFEVVFDYGDHDNDDPAPTESQPWALRPDTYSSNRGAFTQQWFRRCRRIMVFHSFPQLGDKPVLVSSTDLVYDEQTGRSLLQSLTANGFLTRNGGGVERRSLPSLEFHYQNPSLDDAIHELDAPNAVSVLSNEALRAHWLDLHGEALPGLLLWKNDQWQYMRNLGGGDFADASPVEDAFIADEVTRLDLAEGEPEASSVAPPAPPRAKTNVPVPGEEDLHVGYIDLNGDGFDDVVVADNNVIRWYPSRGESGFADPIVLRISNAPIPKPQFLHADDGQVFFAADMNGDGLYDLVRVRRDDVSYWPHLGHGRYGEPVVMAGSLDMPPGPITGKTVFFADLTTTGSSDLVCVGEGEVRYWENLDGARYGQAHRIDAPGLDPQQSHVATTDLFGRAAECIVWVDSQDRQRPVLRYIAPIGERRPDLLSGVDNGRGLEARISYVTTSELRRRDRLHGMDQLATIPRSIQVVERIERRDYVAQTRQLRRYVFRHAAFDSERQRFIGFASQEEYASSASDEYDAPGLFQHEAVPVIADEQRTPPTMIRRWFHTGLMFEGEDITSELATEWFVDPVTHRHNWLSGHQMPLGQQASDIPAAYRALTGRLLREEHYESHAGVPFTRDATPVIVREFTAHVQQVQPSRTGPASFTASANESVTVEHDDDIESPRLEHVVVLATDDFGHETRRATVRYGRHKSPDRAQRVTSIRIDDMQLANRNDQATWYRIGVPLEVVSWALAGAEAPEKGLFAASDVRSFFENFKEVEPGERATEPHKFIVSHTRCRYWANDLSRVLEVGRVESRALLARTERLALTASMAKNAYGDLSDSQLKDLLGKECAYEAESANWWAPSDTVSYDGARFYLPVAWRDAVGREITVRYDEAALNAEVITDAYGVSTQAVQHPRAQRPWKYVDGNNNVVALRFDALGAPLSMAIMGKPDQPQGDILALDKLEATSGDDPTQVVTYDAHTYAERGEPVWVRTRRRHRHRDPETSLQDRISFYDGCGRLLAVAERAGAQWRVVRLFLRDAEGRVVRSGAPIASDRPFPSEAERGQSFANGHFLTYDAQGRLVRITEPGGVSREVRHEPWRRVVSDPNDLVMDSEWYAKRATSLQGRAADFSARAAQQYEARAAALAATHAQSPTVETLDACGRVVAREVATSTGQIFATRYGYDERGHLVEIIDGLGRAVERNTYDLLGHVIKRSSVDGGVTVSVFDATGKLVRSTAPSGLQTRNVYDNAGRLTHVYTRGENKEERLVERTVWGGGDVTVSEAAERNLVGKPHIRLTGLGLESFEVCDWNGNVVRAAYQLASERTDRPNWSAIENVVHAGQVTAFLAGADLPVLDSNVRVIDTIYDASNRVVMHSVLDAITVNYEYGADGNLHSIRARVDDVPGEQVIVQSVQYDTEGRMVEMVYGDGTAVRREFDEAGRIKRVTAGDSYDLAVVYDPNGNLMSYTQMGQLIASFAYDGFDRVIKAEGVDEDDNRFAQSYTYDEAGNVTELASRGAGDEVVQVFTYVQGTNRIESTSNGVSYAYDEAGNVTRIGEHQALTWDSRSRLVCAEDEDQSTLFGHGGRPGVLRRVIKHAGSVGVGDQSLMVLDVAATSDATHVVVRVRVDDVAVADVERTLDTAGGVQGNRQFLLFDQNNDVVTSAEDGTLSPLGYVRPHFEAHMAPMWNNYAATVSVQPVNGRWYAPWLGRFVTPPYVIESARTPWSPEGALHDIAQTAEDPTAAATHRRLFG